MQRNYKYKTYINVLGMQFSVYTNTEIDKNWIAFILRDYLCQKGKEEVSIYLPDAGESGFMRNHLNNLDVADIYVKDSDADAFLWNRNSTPIPPFLLNPYKGRYLLLHGCGVQDEDGKTTMIIGDSMTGKTYLSLLLLKNKYKLITDDLIVFNVKENCIYPYSKPIGLRENTLTVDEKFQEFIDEPSSEKLMFTSYEGKKTWLIHIDDVYKDCFVKDAIHKVDRVILLDKEKESVVRMSCSEMMKAICNSIIDSGADKKDAIVYLSRFFMRTKECFAVPVYNSEIAANLIMGRK